MIAVALAGMVAADFCGDVRRRGDPTGFPVFQDLLENVRIQLD
jgi:hypothetical protein